MAYGQHFLCPLPVHCAFMVAFYLANIYLCVQEHLVDLEDGEEDEVAVIAEEGEEHPEVEVLEGEGEDEVCCTFSLSTDNRIYTFFRWRCERRRSRWWTWWRPWWW